MAYRPRVVRLYTKIDVAGPHKYNLENCRLVSAIRRASSVSASLKTRFGLLVVSVRLGQVTRSGLGVSIGLWVGNGAEGCKGVDSDGTPLLGTV